MSDRQKKTERLKRKKNNFYVYFFQENKIGTKKKKKCRADFDGRTPYNSQKIVKNDTLGVPKCIK